MANTTFPPLAVAPMMDYTDRHCRFFHRLVAPHALVYTEMVVADALVRGGRIDLLRFDAEEHPIALQIGGWEARTLASAAALAAGEGYDEINLNVGCPSDRVKSGRFGACLMAEPATVAEAVAAMRSNVAVPVTVKTRIGIDDQDSFEFLYEFARMVHEAGADRLIVHARKAWLAGLSPKQNREIPPLDYERVRQLKSALPTLPIVINGGINDQDRAFELASDFDGIMLGRQAYAEPRLLSRLDANFFGTDTAADREVLCAYDNYVSRNIRGGSKLRRLLRPLSGFFYGQPGGRAWRQALNQLASERWVPGSLIDLGQSHRDRWSISMPAPQLRATA